MILNDRAGSIPASSTKTNTPPGPPGTYARSFVRKYATLAQLVELLICNQMVAGSSPAGGSMSKGYSPVFGPSL